MFIDSKELLHMVYKAAYFSAVAFQQLKFERPFDVFGKAPIWDHQTIWQLIRIPHTSRRNEM